MRLLGCLQGLFEGDGIFPLLEQFFERAADLQMQSSEDVSISERLQAQY
jgi:nuclear cap-binding protein subunit 1